MNRDYKKAVVGTNTQEAAMIFKTDAPLDDRTAIRSRAALISQTAFGKNGNSSDKGWLFLGLITCDRETGDIYTLKNKETLTLKSDLDLSLMSDQAIDLEIALSWKKMATIDDIDEITKSFSGVFKFQGVADSIDKDYTTITITPLIYGKGAGRNEYTCTGFNYDLGHVKYYKWECDNSKPLYTEEGDSSKKLYTISDSEIDVLYVEHNSEIFYPDGVEREKSKFTSLIGNTIYADSIIDTTSTLGPLWFYSSSAIQIEDTKLFQETPVKYEAYTFNSYILDGEQLYAQSGTGVTINADDEGVNGHVYQIEDKEYASNGIIWVELGSPTQEIKWLVI